VAGRATLAALAQPVLAVGRPSGSGTDVGGSGVGAQQRREVVVEEVGDDAGIVRRWRGLSRASGGGLMGWRRRD
jgi:hypothetical protein